MAVQVLVPDDHIERARAIVADWDAGEVPDEEELARLAEQSPDDGSEVLL